MTYFFATPVVIGTLYYLVTLVISYIPSFARNIWYDPELKRFWYVVAWINLVFAPIWTNQEIPFNTTLILLAFLIYFWQEGDWPSWYDPDCTLNRLA